MAASALPACLPLPNGQQHAGGQGNNGAGHPDGVLGLVLAGIQSPETRRHYGQSLLEFARWQIAAPSPAMRGFDQRGLTEWRNELTSKGLSPSTVNQKLAAIRRLARIAGEQGMIPTSQAAGLVATRNVRQLGDRVGNWLTKEQAQKLIEAPTPLTLKGLRDRAALAVLVGCGLRRDESTRITVEDVVQRDGRWVIADLRGKHGRIRTVPVPNWVKCALDTYLTAAQISTGRIFRAVNRYGNTITHNSISPQAIFDIAATYGSTIGVALAPHDLRRTCAKLCRKGGGELEQIQMLLGHASIQTTERYLGIRQDLTDAPNDHMGLKWRGQ